MSLHGDVARASDDDGLGHLRVGLQGRGGVVVLVPLDGVDGIEVCHLCLHWEGATAGLPSYAPCLGLIYVFNGVLLCYLLQYVFFMLFFGLLADKICTVKQTATAGLSTYSPL